mgnify:CR=1 FL=1
MSQLRAMQTEAVDRGTLQINVTSSVNAFPVERAEISISYTGVPESTLEKIQTDSSGQTETIELAAPPEEWSLDIEEDRQPYSEYTLSIKAPGFEPVNIAGTEILANVKAIQNIQMKPADVSGEEDQVFVIPAHTLYGDYPPKIAEAEIKPVTETGEIVLSRVVVPEYIVVHDGSPRDSTATNYYVKYKDYIKNVASSEIYATWPENTIRANVLAIMSFTLNRVYTEWYRNKGYDFTITSSTAYDHKWIYGRNIFASIDRIVDELFENYLSRPNVRQPILTQYCDGKRVKCPNWLSQWGSCNLGEQGYSTLEIIRNYYGDEMYINTAEQISGIPASWPGYDLTIGASGQKVRQLQEQLDTIAQVYTAIPRLVADGVYGENTQASVRAFQKIFDLPQTGITDFATWYKISQIYVGITRIAEGIPRG